MDVEGNGAYVFGAVDGGARDSEPAYGGEVDECDCGKGVGDAGGVV